MGRARETGRGRLPFSRGFRDAPQGLCPVSGVAVPPRAVGRRGVCGGGECERAGGDPPLATRFGISPVIPHGLSALISAAGRPSGSEADARAGFPPGLEPWVPSSGRGARGRILPRDSPPAAGGDPRVNRPPPGGNSSSERNLRGHPALRSTGAPASSPRSRRWARGGSGEEFS